MFLGLLLAVGTLMSGWLMMAPVFAQSVNRIGVSLSLYDTSYKPIKNGSYEVRFAIYTKNRTDADAYPSNADDRVWEETQTVEVKNGILSAMLGGSSSFPTALFSSDSDYYLGVRIGKDSEMTPRKRMSAVPFALNAQYLQGTTIGEAEGNIPVLSKGGKFLKKYFSFGEGDGDFLAGNDSRLSDIHSQNTDTGTSETDFNIGSGSSLSSNNFTLSVSDGSTRPALRYNATTSEWEFSNNGSTYQTIGDIGNYVATITAGNGISGSSTTEGGTPTLSVNILDAIDGTGLVSSPSGLEFSGAGNNQLSLLQGCSNGQGISYNTATDVWECTSFSAGLAGTGTAGYATYWSGVSSLGSEQYLSVSRGGTGVNGSAAPNGSLLIGNGSDYTLATLTGSNGLSVSNGIGSITLSLDVATTGTSATTSSNSGLETTGTGLRLLGGCINDQVLSWNTALEMWVCSNKTGGTSDWSSGGSFTYLTNVTDSLVLGGSATDSGFFFNVPASTISFEGVTGNAFETILAVVDPTADQTITFPNASGTVALTSDLHTAVTVSGAYDYITLSGQDIVRGQIDLTTDVTGTLPVANGGTGASSLTNLITLSTHTTGNYVSSATTNGGLSMTGTEGASLGILLPSATDALSSTTSSGSGLELLASGLTLLQGCANNEVLSWNETADTWGCASISGVGGLTGTGVNGYNAYWTGANTLSNEQFVAVSRGGTGAGTFTTNGVLYGNATSAFGVTAAGTSGQLLVANGSGIPTFVTMGTDATLSSAGALTIAADAVALTTDTTGNYVSSVTNGSGISGGNGGSEGAALTLSLGALTADWNQTGAFNISLNNVGAGLKMLENGGTPTLFGIFDVADLSSTDKTYTFPNASGTVALTSDLHTAVTVSGAYDYITLSGQDIVRGQIDLTTDVTGTLPVANGGTGASSLTNLITLSTHTTGNYVSSATTNGGLSMTGTEGASLGILLPSATDALSSTTSSGSGLELLASGLTLLQGCANNEVLSWNETADTWGCASISGVGGLTGTGVNGYNAYWTGANTLSNEQFVAVSRGGTGAGTFTTNGVLYGNATSAFGVTAAGTSGQLLVANGSGIPTFVTMGTDATLSSAGALTIAADAVALTTDTTGNYVSSVTNGSGISGGNGGSEGAALTLSLGALTADWNQTGAFNISLNNVGAGLKMLENGGTPTLFGIFDVADLSSTDKTYTFPNASGTVALTSDLHTAVTVSGAYDYITLSGQDIVRGQIDLTTDVTGTLPVANGGTGASSLTNLITLSTHTTGNYVSSATTNGGLSMTGTEGASLGILLPSATDALSSTTSSGSGLELLASGLTLLQGCANNEVLSWNETADTWGCASISGVGGLTGTGVNGYNAYWTGANTLSNEQFVAVSRGGTGAGTFTTNGVLYGNATSAFGVTAAGTSGQLLVANGSGIPTFVTMGTDATLSSAGALTIAADAVALTTDTTGNYVSSVTNGSGISGGNGGSEGAALTLSLGALTADWNQTGAFNISLNNVGAGLKMLENGGTPTLFGIFDVADLSSTDKTYTFPDLTGTVALTANNLGAFAATTSAQLAGVLSDETGSGGVTVFSSSPLITTPTFRTSGTFDTATATDDRLVLSVTTGGAARFDGTLTASDLTAARTWTLPDTTGTIITTGDSGTITGTMIANDTVALTTDTTGNYVSSATTNGGLSMTGTEGASLGILLPSATDALSSTTSSGSGLELLASGLTLLQGCANNEVLSWNETADTWGCASISGVGGLTGTGVNGYNAYWTGANTLSNEQFVAVSRGGTGAGTFTTNGVLYGNATSAFGVTAAGTSGQLLVANGSGIPTFVTMGTDATLSSAGALTIAADAVALTTDTTGNYVSSATTNGGLSMTGTEGASLGILLPSATDALSSTTSSGSGLELLASGLTLLQGCANNDVLAWNETADTWGCTSVGGVGAGDITAIGDVLSGDAFTASGTQGTSLYFYDADGRGQLTIANLTAARTWTLPDTTGTIITTGDSGTITGTMIANDTVALTTDTTGNYVSSATTNGGLSMTGTEGASLGILLPSATDALSSTTSSGSGLELLASGLTLLQGCANNEVLSWNETADTWGCASISGVGGLTGTGVNGYNAYWTGANTLSNEQFVAVSRGGTGAGTFTTNGVLYGNATSAFGVTAAGTSGQLLVANGSGIPTFVTMGTDATLSSAGALTIAADAVALTTDTTGNYVSSVTNGSGISGGNGGSEGAALTLSLGALTADWNQTGAFNISLNNVGAGLKMLENGGTPTLFGIFDVADLSSTDKTYTFPDLTGTVALTANNLGAFAATTSAQLAGVLSDETGSGGVTVFSSSPLITTPTFRTSGTFDTATATDDRLVLSVTTGGAARFDGTLTASDLTAARTWTLPDTTGTIITTGDSGTITGTMIANDTVALTTDTTGNYVSSVTNGSGISGGNGGSEGAALTLSLGALTADWNQTGAFNISLNNVGAGLKMLENGGTPTLFGIFDVADLSSTDKTYTFPDLTGTVALTANNLGAFAATTSAQLAGVLSDETGSGGVTVFSSSPLITTPTFRTSGTFDTATATDDRLVLSVTTGGAARFDGTLTASDLTAARTWTLPDTTGTIITTGDSGTITGTMIANDTVALTTDTTGNYVSSATTNGGLSMTGTEGASLGILLPSATDALSSTTSSGSGLELLASGLTLLQGCANNEVLSWNETADTWGCASISGVGGLTGTGVNGYNAYWTGANTLSNEQFVAVSRGGTGAGTFTTNGVLYGNATSAFGVTAAGTSGQLLVANGSGIPTFVTMGTDATLSSAGALTIAADAVALTTDTTGNYVSSVTNGSGISGGNGGSEGAALTLSLGALTADWNQTGAFNISLNNVGAGLKMLENGGTPTLFGIFDVADLSSTDKTYTFPDLTGTVALTANNLGAFAATTSAQLAGVLSDETGSGGVTVFSSSPLITTPTFRTSGTFDTATATDDRLVLSVTTGGAARFDGTLTASDLTAARTWTLPDTTGTIITTGDSGTITGTMIANDTVALTTDTTGNYVSSATTNGGLSMTGTEGASLGILLPSATDALSSTTSSGSGLELLASGLTLLQGCANNEVLSWNETADTWGCASVSGVGGVTGTGANGQVAYWTGTSSIAGENQLNVSRGGTGLSGSAAANGTLLIGNGTGYSLANITSSGSSITITNGAGTINIESSLGTSVDLTTEVTGILPLANGGTNKNMTASNGGILYSDADSFELSAIGTSGQALISGGAGAPTWFAPTAGSVLFAGTSGILEQDNANFFFDNSTNRLGLGTAAPSTLLELSGAGADVVSTITAADATYDPILKFRTGASPAVQFSLGVDNTDSGKFKIYSGDGLGFGDEFTIDASGVTSIANLNLGATSFDTDAGAVVWVDMPVTASAIIGTVERYTAQIDGNSLLTVYSESDGAGSIQNSGVSVGNSTLQTGARFAVTQSSTATAAGTLYGTYNSITDTGIVTTGTDTTYGNYTSVTRTGATGGTIDNYGEYISVTADNAGAGTSTNTGLYVSATGADTNYAAIFNAGNVGIGDATPVALFTVGAGDLFQVNSSGAIAAAAGITSSGTITFSGLSTAGIVTNTSGGVLGTTGTVGVALGGTGTSTVFTLGSIVFAGASGVYTQDNANFFFDDTNNRLGLGTTTPGSMLDLFGTSNALRLSYDVSNYNTISTTSTGDLSLASSNTSEAAVVIGTGSASQDVSIQYDSQTNDYFAGVDITTGNYMIGSGFTVQAASAFLNITSGGLVGINMTPTARFDITHSSTSTTGATEYSERNTFTDTGIVTTGTDTTYGEYIGVTRTGATGGTINNYGEYITLTGDTGGTSTNTGLSVTVSGADTNYAAIFTGGNVGIGTATPVSPLTVDSASGGVPTIIAMRSPIASQDTGVSLAFQSTGGVNYASIAGARGTSSAEGYLAFSTRGVSGSERMRIDTNGNVGIGTTAPSSLLSIYGAGADVVSTITAADATYDPILKFRTGASPAVQFSLGVDNTDSDKFKIYSGDGLGSGDEFTIDASGVTSIANLNLGATTFDTDAGAVTWIDMPVTSSASAGTIESYSAKIDENDLLTIYAESDGAGSIQNSAVGIGLAIPIAKLDIVQSSTTATASSTYYGLRTTVTDSGVVVSGTDRDYGTYTSLTRTGATATSGTVYTYGNYTELSHTGTSSGTVNAYGSYITATGDTGGSNSTLYGSYINAVGADTTYGLYANVTGTTASTSYGLMTNLTDATTGANTNYGSRVTLSDTGIVTTGTDTNYADYLSLTRTGASGGTINNYGQYITLTGDAGGTSNNTGLYVSVSGADTNYAAVFANGYVGIGYTTPAARLDISGDVTTATASAEMITASIDRDFTTGIGNWTTGSNWAYGTDNAAHTAGTTGTLSLANGNLSAAPVSGNFYQVTFTITTTTAGTLTPSFGGTNGTVMGQATGTITAETNIITAVSAGALTFTPDANWAGTIDDVSVKLITRSNATQIVRNSDNTIGLELRAGGTGLSNTFVGANAGRLTTTGSQNIALGYGALSANTTGNQNIAIGYNTLSQNTTGVRNIASGYQALDSNTIGNYNVATGYQALGANVSGDSAVAYGYSSLQSNTTGDLNAAFGALSLRDNTTGGSNTAIGYGTLVLNVSGGSNTASGVYALGEIRQQMETLPSGRVLTPDSNQTGANNTAVGTAAGQGVSYELVCQ
jgi:hypothetical protein